MSFTWIFVIASLLFMLGGAAFFWFAWRELVQSLAGNGCGVHDADAYRLFGSVLVVVGLILLAVTLLVRHWP